ncbi:MAG: hypothetical protein BAJATHORv1_10114 [Candidatus Thorarchaeota archaeon]|nr:MAG: hypothetical protein BAJATHORv1_10114 [Candidatus Thorarchaeota archaeon]
MDKSEYISDIKQDLERAKIIIKEVIGTLASISDKMGKVEQNIRIKQSALEGDYIIREPSIIICVDSVDSENKRVVTALHKLVSRNHFKPSEIAIDDAKENLETCNKIANILRAHIQKYGSTISVIYLKTGRIPQKLDKNNVIIIGKRYHRCGEEIAARLEKNGFEVVTDLGEFGGGRLIYHIITELDKYDRGKAVEITISQSLLHDEAQLFKLLNAFSLVVS